jgi:hypothetical protein
MFSFRAGFYQYGIRRTDKRTFAASYTFAGIDAHGIVHQGDGMKPACRNAFGALRTLLLIDGVGLTVLLTRVDPDHQQNGEQKEQSYPVLHFILFIFNLK